jgi:DNA topoisomerase-1
VQARYTKEWERERERHKIRRLERFDERFWKDFDRKLSRRLDEGSPLALAIRVLQLCNFRIGSSRHLKRNRFGEDHYGLTTLRGKHARGIDGSGGAELSFVGKSGKVNVCEVNPNGLRDRARVLSHLLAPRGEEDPLFPGVTAAKVRAALEGHGLHPKDFRTYYANRVLLEALRRADASDDRSRRRVVDEAVRDVARGLDNTPAVVRSSYVSSGILEAYLHDPEAFDAFLRDHEKSSARDLVSAAAELFSPV